MSFYVMKLLSIPLLGSTLNKEFLMKIIIINLSVSEFKLKANIINLNSLMLLN